MTQVKREVSRGQEKVAQWLYENFSGPDGFGAWADVPPEKREDWRQEASSLLALVGHKEMPPSYSITKEDGTEFRYLPLAGECRWHIAHGETASGAVNLATLIARNDWLTDEDIALFGKLWDAAQFDAAVL